MTRGFGKVLRAVALSAAAVLAAGSPAAQPARTPNPSPSVLGGVVVPDAVARYEVRLRKLHLVRPDLIPYPINYDVYC
jgi:hypothetical protein